MEELKAKNLKLSEKNTGVNRHDAGSGKVLLDMTPTERATREK